MMLVCIPPHIDDAQSRRKEMADSWGGARQFRFFRSDNRHWGHIPSPPFRRGAHATSDGQERIAEPPLAGFTSVGLLHYPYCCEP